MAYFPRKLESFRSMDYDSLLYCKTNIGGYFFDGYLNLSVNSSLEITQHPVESGSAISDHSYMKPRVELPVARVRTVEISAADQTTVNTEMGNISATYPSDAELESLLSMLAGFLRST